MSLHDSMTSPCHLIGDIVRSREVADRRALHRAVTCALDDVGERVSAIRALRVTVGDEVQGSYASLGAALDAALRLRLRLAPEVDLRVGIGRGPATVLDPARGIEDGPGWWAAREAIEAVESAQARPVTRHLRTAYRAHVDDPVADAVNAALHCRDHMVGSMSARSIRLMTALMEPSSTQAEIAAAEGISASAVSRRVRSDGIGMVLEANALLVRMP
jgi:hypothetical protein